MNLQSLIDRFRQSSPVTKIAVSVLALVWLLVLCTVVGATVLLWERPSQADQSTTPSANGPAITLTPATGSVGSSVTIRGEGWNPGSMVLIYAGDTDPAIEPSYALASAIANEAGQFTIELVIPSETRWTIPGPMPLIARTDDNSVSAQATLNLVAPSGQPSQTPVVTTPTIPATSTPEPTATSSIPPTPTPTPLPGVPVATVNVDLNVRGGPGTAYPILGLLRAGQSAEITGRSNDGRWWQIKFPGVVGERGWLAAEYVAARNTGNVPIVQAPSLPVPPTPTPRPPAPPTPIIISDWRGEYYSNISLSGAPALVRNDVVVSFNWGNGAPGPNLPADNFSARWTRSLNFPGGLYRFTVQADDGVRLWVDNGLIIDQWHDSSPTTYVADLKLASGPHNLRLEYYERSGTGLIDLRWQRLTEPTNQQPRPVAGGPYTVNEGSAVILDGSRSWDPDGGLVRYEWDFNYDGYNFNRDATGVNPKATYQDGPTTLIIALRVTDNFGANQIATAQVRINNVAPQVEAGGPYNGQAGSSIGFVGTATDPGTVDRTSLTYRWDFGDGTTGYGAVTGHTYNQPGTYTARLSVTDKDGAQTSDTATVQVSATNRAPVAVISGPTSGKTGQTLNFNGSSSSDSDGTITSYAWNFGDGTTANGVNVSHSFNRAGTYQVTLTVLDNGGLSGSATVTVQISDVAKTPPTAVISGPSNGLVGTALNFSGSSSSDSDGTITSYSWDFGDGTTGSGVDTSHTYNAAGTYQVTLTVVDNDGLTGQDTQSVVIDQIIIINEPPTPVLNGPTTGQVGASLSFDANGSTDSDGQIVGYLWDFGDGIGGNGPAVSHTYNQAGSYTVTLTVTDDDNQSNTTTQQVVIN